MSEQHLFSFVEQYGFAFVLVLCRISAFIGFFPLFTQRQIPVSVKAGLSVALSVFWFEQVAAPVGKAENLDMFLATMWIAREIGIGLLLAMTLGFILVPAKIAGAYIGQEVGLSLASISNPGSTDQSTLVTMVFEALSIFVFFLLKIHHFVILCVHYTFTSSFQDANLLDLPTEGLVNMVNDLPEFGLMIVAPIGICMFLLIVALSYLNKAAPTLNLFSVGMPVRSGIGILCLLVFMPAIIHSIYAYFSRIQQDIESMLVYFQ